MSLFLPGCCSCGTNTGTCAGSVGSLTMLQSCCFSYPSELDVTIPTIWSDIKCSYCPSVGGTYTVTRNQATFRGTSGAKENEWTLEIQDVCTVSGVTGVATADLQIMAYLFCQSPSLPFCTMQVRALLYGVSSGGTVVGGRNQSVVWELNYQFKTALCDSISWTVPFSSAQNDGLGGLPYCTDVAAFPVDALVAQH